jgi:hypothetical protein
MKVKVIGTSSQLVPQEILDILGPPPVLTPAESKAYFATLACFAKEVGPRDLITWFLIKDLADYRCMMALYRRLKTLALQHAQEERVRHAIEQLQFKWGNDANTLHRLANEEYAKAAATIKDAEELKKRQAQIVKELETDLAEGRQRSLAAQDVWRKHEKTEKDLVANFNWTHYHEKLDSLLEITERRFFTTLREIEKHLGGFGQSLRDNVRNVIDGDAVEVEAQAIPLSPVVKG